MPALVFRKKKSKQKSVLALSTNHDAGLEERMIAGKVKKKPPVIFCYNKNVGGGDVSIRKIYLCAAERYTRGIWKKIMATFIDNSSFDQLDCVNLPL